jgi:hypothetical protein
VEGNSVTVRNSVIWGNGGTDFFVDDGSWIDVAHTLSEEPIEGRGNVSADPRFADPGSYDFHLRSTTGRWNAAAREWVTDAAHSPAIDAADPKSDFALEPAPRTWAPTATPSTPAALSSSDLDAARAPTEGVRART